MKMQKWILISVGVFLSTQVLAAERLKDENLIQIDSTHESESEPSCQLTVWGTYSYQNLELYDSARTYSAECNGMIYKEVEGVYMQYAWDDKILTIYPESLLVTLAKTVSLPRGKDKIKIKKKNIPKDSTMDKWTNVLFKDSVQYVSTYYEDNYRIDKLKQGEQQTTVKTNINTGRVVERVTVSKRANALGEMEVERVVEKLLSIHNDENIVGKRMNLSQIMDLETGSLTQRMLESGFYMFEL